MNLRKLITTVATGASIAALSIALGAPGYTFFGDAQYFSPGNASLRAVELSSECPSGYPTCFGDGSFTFSGIDFVIPAGTTFADLASLATDYNFTDASCGGGSPRFQINVEDTGSGDSGNIFVYIGPPPSYTGCAMNTWLNTGDLLEGVNPVDTGQLNGGTFYDPYATALGKYGGYEVTGVQLVADGGWAVAGNVQTVLVDNTDIDGTLYDYEPPQPQSKNDCKKGGWMTLFDSQGNSFKNQGDCVSFVATDGRNLGAGD